MSQTPPDQVPAASSLRFLDVSFTIDISVDRSPSSSLPSWPPGGGLGVRKVEIAPVRLEDLDADAVAEIVRRRAGDMALIAQALAFAEVQFADALQAASSP